MEENIERIKELVFREKKVADEFASLFNYLKRADEREKRMLKSQAEKLKIVLKKINDELLEKLQNVNLGKPLGPKEDIIPKKKLPKPKKRKSFNLSKILEKEKIPELDIETLKRLKKKKEKIIKKKEPKPSIYVMTANNFFSDFAKSLIKNKKFRALERNLIKSNLTYTPASYISILIFTTIVSAIIGFFIMIFFLFFNISPEFPLLIRTTEGLATRLLKVFWIFFIVPLGTFLFMYIYPSLEKKTIESKINQELPFATIHMAAISGSMIEPTNVFRIISSTKDYPFMEKEFNKLLNKINVYGFDLVTALKDSALNCPSQKLAELLNGLATTITSGGDLFDFFDKRAQSLLFEYRLDKEKRTKTAETFMDIYISVVIAAPMILMLLLMMIRISGLGAGLSTSTITFLVVGGVSIINIFFLVFLQLKQSATT